MDWLLFVHSLPGQNGALRISVWRSLQAAGAGSLRDGVSILPERPEFADAFAGLRRNIVASGGTAHVLRIPTGAEPADAELRLLFDRAKDYADLIAGVERTLSALGESSESDARRNLRQHSRELARIEAMDFFGSDGRDRAQALVASLTDSIAKTFSPDEPVAVSAVIPRLRLDEFRRRVWVTRPRMWVDRVASAWLIRRFVDPDATFQWLDDFRNAPPDAVGFDYDGATFTHVDDRTTFEVIAASFGFAENAALARIGGIVHALDIGGPTVPEAAGFEAVLAGTRDRSRDDRELLSKMGDVLDAFYDAFANDVSSPAR
ncbi:MAG TPA: chromate resistance protein ChrB domain-containing protein [Candidatus Elarobacter sp.]